MIRLIVISRMMKQGTSILHYTNLEELGEGEPTFVMTSMDRPVLRSIDV